MQQVTLDTCLRFHSKQLYKSNNEKDAYSGRSKEVECRTVIGWSKQLIAGKQWQTGNRLSFFSLHRHTYTYAREQIHRSLLLITTTIITCTYCITVTAGHRITQVHMANGDYACTNWLTMQLITSVSSASATYADNLALPAFACCFWAPAVQQQTDISCPPGTQQQTCGRGFAAVAYAGTDRRTLYHYTDPALHTVKEVSIMSPEIQHIQHCTSKRLVHDRMDMQSATVTQKRRLYKQTNKNMLSLIAQLSTRCYPQLLLSPSICRRWRSTAGTWR